MPQFASTVMWLRLAAFPALSLLIGASLGTERPARYTGMRVVDVASLRVRILCSGDAVRALLHRLRLRSGF